MHQRGVLAIGLCLASAACVNRGRVVEEAAETIDYDVLLGRGEVFAVAECVDGQFVVEAWIEQECLRWHAERDVVSEAHATTLGALGSFLVGNAMESAAGTQEPDDEQEEFQDRELGQPRDRAPRRRDVWRDEAERAICRLPAAGLPFEVDEQVFFADADGRFVLPDDGTPVVVRHDGKSWAFACDDPPGLEAD